MKESTTDRQERIPHFRQDVIRNAKVAVLGAGATGNEVLKNLTLTGFGYVIVCDMDHISTSNLSRTVLFTKDDVGKRKAETAAKRFEEMNIDNGKADFFDGDLCHVLGEGVFRHVDLVIGCIDNDQTRLFASNICQLLEKPYIDTGIGDLNWNVFASSGKKDCPSFNSTMSKKAEDAGLSRVRNSCDVTRIKAAKEGHIPTIVVTASCAGAIAVGEAIKICHQLKDPASGLPAPRYGVMSLFTGADNSLSNLRIRTRSDCKETENYNDYGGVIETDFSAHMKLRDVLISLRERYGEEYRISLYKDCACSDRSFVSKAHCEHCGKEIDVYRPQPLSDEDLLCEHCKETGAQPVIPSGALLKSSFSLADEERILDMTLLELGIPLFHIIDISPVNGGPSMYLELTGDMDEVMPGVPK